MITDLAFFIHWLRSVIEYTLLVLLTLIEIHPLLALPVLLVYLWLVFWLSCLVHEMGHYLAFLYYGAEVACVSIGKGWKDKEDKNRLSDRIVIEFRVKNTLFKIYPFHASGYVTPYSWNKLASFPQVMIYLAGSLSNLALSIICIPLILWTYYHYWDWAFLFLLMLGVISLIDFICVFMPNGGTDADEIRKIYRDWRKSKNDNIS